MTGIATLTEKSVANRLVDDDAQPLHGVVLCCTSIVQEQNHHLAEIGRQMGASLRYELTLDVTHLIVGKINTEKYKYIARARPEVKVVLPEWLEAVRQSWMDGEGIDISALEKKFRCPTMHGLQICVTGFDTSRWSLSSVGETHGF